MVVTEKSVWHMPRAHMYVYKAHTPVSTASLAHVHTHIHVPPVSTVSLAHA